MSTNNFAFSTTTSYAKLAAATTRAASVFDVVLELQLWWLGGTKPELSPERVEALLCELSELIGLLEARVNERLDALQEEAARNR